MLDVSAGLLLLATASASALALFLGSALSFCGVSCMLYGIGMSMRDTDTARRIHI